MMENDRTLIAKFYGLYTIKIENSQELCCIITENLVGNDFLNVERMYDLKGSLVERVVKLTEA